MTTAARLPLTDRQIASILEAIEQRDTALADLKITPTAQWQTGWARDRMSDVAFANHFIARSATRWGYTPAELIAACVGHEANDTAPGCETGAAVRSPNKEKA